MGFRLGEKGKKALRIGSKVGGIAVALAGAGVLGKKEVDTIKEQPSRDFAQFVEQGKTRGDIGVSARPQPQASASGQLQAPTGAQSKKVAVAKVGVGAVGDFLQADSKVGKAKVVVSTAKAIKGAKATRGDEAIQQQIKTAGEQAKARSTPVARPKPQERLDIQSRQILAQKQQAEQILAQKREAEQRLRSRRRRR